MKRKSIQLLGYGAFCVLFTALGLMGGGCGNSSTSGIYTLTNPPSGFIFTNNSGTPISSSNPNSTAQLRNTSNQILFQFQVNGDVNFQNVIAGRNVTDSFLNFPSSSDKAGITGNVTMYVPCNPSQNALRICPSASELEDIGPSCTDQILLTPTQTTSGIYDWSNANNSGPSDCQVQMDIANFNTGASGTILLPYNISLEEPNTCEWQCQPTEAISLGGILLAQAVKISDAPVAPTTTLAGITVTITTTELVPSIDPDYISPTLDSLPLAIMTFVDEQNVSLDAYGYNYLLNGRTVQFPICNLLCTNEFTFSMNGQANSTGYLITGYSGENVYFVNPTNTSTLLSVVGGDAATSTLVITDAGTGTTLDFTLGEGDFAMVSGFGTLDLNNNVENSVTLNAASLLAFSDTGTLKILGTSLDTVTMSDSTPWTQGSSTITLNEVIFTPYQSGDAILLIQQGVNVVNGL